MILTDDFCAALRSIPLTGATYHACFGEIATALPRAWAEEPEWTGSQKEWRSKLIEGMATWHSVFGKLGAR
jgi:signal-transduction protein with cAMP-binding, CBS, and nucleotidyltransferase domain